MLEELQMIEDIKVKGNMYICMFIYNCCYCCSLREKQKLFLAERQVFIYLFFYDFGSFLIASDQMKQLLLKSMRTGLRAGEEKASGENVYITVILDNHHFCLCLPEKLILFLWKICNDFKIISDAKHTRNSNPWSKCLQKVSQISKNKLKRMRRYSSWGFEITSLWM